MSTENLERFFRPRAARSSRDVRDAAVTHALIAHGHALTTLALRKADSRSPSVRAMAAMVLGHAIVRDRRLVGRARAALLALADDHDADVRAQVSVALGRRKHRSVVEAALRLSSDRDPVVRAGAVDSLSRLGSLDERARGRVIEMGRDRAARVRVEVAFSLGFERSRAALDTLGALGSDPSPSVRREAASALFLRLALEQGYGRAPSRRARSARTTSRGTRARSR